VFSDNSEVDENLEVGVFGLTVDDWEIFFGFSVIFKVTDSGGSAEAALTINLSTGSESFSGTVSPITGPAMVLFGESDDGEDGGDGPEWITFTDSTGYFEIHYDDIEYRQFFVVDIKLSLETGQFLFKGGSEDEESTLPDHLDIDISRDAVLQGMISDSENDDGIGDVYVGVSGRDYGSITLKIGIFSISFSDSSGHYELPLQAYPIIYGFEDNRVMLEHPDYYPNQCDGVLEDPIEEGETVIIDCSMNQYVGFVEGHVYSSDTGGPLGNIEIWIGDYTENDYIAQTDEDGFYRSGVEESGQYTVCANDWENGFYQGSCVDSLFIPEGTIVVDFYLDSPDGSISGTVTDAETAEPIGGIEVFANDSDWWNGYETETDNNGNFTIYVQNSTYTVCAGPNDWYQEDCIDSVTVQDNDVTVDFSLEGPEGIIEGYVTDSVTGDSLYNISVLASNEYWDWYDTYTDENGYFKMGVANGAYYVVFRDFQGFYEDTSITDIVVQDNTVDASILMTPVVFDGAVQGTVTDEGGSPIFGIVFIVNFTTGQEYMLFTDSVTGEYYRPLQNGSYLVLTQDLLGMYLPSYEFVEINNDTVTVDFVLQEININAVIKGMVIDTTSGNPLSDAFLEAIVMPDTLFEMELGFEGFSEEDGSFEIGVMGFDNYPYKLCGEWGDYYMGYEGCEDDIYISEGDTVEVTLFLGPGGGPEESAIKGYVYDPEGETIANALLFAMNYSTGDSFSTQTDSYGYFYMDVTNGYYVVCAYDTESGMSACDEFYVWDEVVYLELYLEDYEYPEGVTLDNGEISVTIYDNGYMGSCGGTDEPGIEWNDTEYLCAGGILIGFQVDSLYGGYIVGPEEFYNIEPITIDTTDDGLIVHLSYGFPEWTDEYHFLIDQTVTLSDLSGFETQYVVTNQSMYGVSTIYLVPFMDFDIGDEYEDDGAGSVGNINEPGLVSYMYDMDGDGGEAPGYIGIEMFDQTSHQHVSSFPDDEEWEFLTEDIHEEDTQEPGDYMALQITGPFDLDIGESITLTVGAGVGDGLDGMISVLDALHELSIVSGEEAMIPESFALYQNYPNPFNPTTTIEFYLETKSIASLQIYDIKGRLLKTLVSGKLAPGIHSVKWDASNVASGIYIYRFTAGDPSSNSGQGFVESKKLILLK